MSKIKLMSHGSTNTKTNKNQKIVESYILHLSPYKLNTYGKNVCGHASAGCAAACLNTAGRGVFSNVQNARIRKTDWFFSDMNGFLKQLLNELVTVNSKDKDVAIRLNGTSDLDFIELLRMKLDIYVLEALNNIKFYDYTKNIKRALKYLGSDYNLTFSRSEDNDEDCIKYLSAGGNVAIVFDELPTHWNGFKVIDGDENDLRYMDERGVVVGLKAKGKAKKDTIGFVVKADLENASIAV